MSQRLLCDVQDVSDSFLLQTMTCDLCRHQQCTGNITATSGKTTHITYYMITVKHNFMFNHLCDVNGSIMFITGPPIQSGDVPSCDFMYAKAFILFYLFNIMITNPNPFKCRDSKHHFSSSWSVSTACKFNFVEGCFFFFN